MSLAVVDLFSGCGGLGVGAAMAGFKNLISVEVDPTLHSAYKLNFPGSKAHTRDVATLDDKFWAKALPTAERPEVLGLLGGPPCQGFSRMGKSAKDDPRNTLVFEYFRQVLLLKPDFFVFENVLGILDDKNRPHLDAGLHLVAGDYALIGPTILDASELGAPTKRKRVIVVGIRGSSLGLQLSFGPQPVVHVGAAIADLPRPVAQSTTAQNFDWTAFGSADGRTIGRYAQSARQKSPAGVGYKRAKQELEQKRVSGNYETLHTPPILARWAGLSEGDVDPVSKAPRLRSDGFAPTLRAGTGPDKGSFQAVRPIHPTENRVITVREAARIQGFPDWFVFHPSKWHSFRMIGNSVSPIMSRAILEKIRDHFATEAPVSVNDR